VHRVLEKLRFGDALPTHRRVGFGLGWILFGEKPMRGQMQNVGRMDLEQRFFCCLFLGEVDQRRELHSRPNFPDLPIVFIADRKYRETKSILDP
jgi:hypothetical protein